MTVCSTAEKKNEPFHTWNSYMILVELICLDVPFFVYAPIPCPPCLPTMERVHCEYEHPATPDTIAAHLLGGDGVPFLVGQQQPVDSCLVRQLVADALLDAARSHFYIAQTEETHVRTHSCGHGRECGWYIVLGIHELLQTYSCTYMACLWLFVHHQRMHEQS